MHLSRLLVPLLLIAPLSASESPGPAVPVQPVTLTAIQEIQAQIDAVRNAGHPRYQPRHVYVVDPATQRLHILAPGSFQVELTLLAGTGSNGVGFGDGQTPPGFYTMGGVRIARNASSDIQTGDSRPGVSGVYAELLYPPTHPEKAKRGRVPINVVIHSFNPKVSATLRRRHEDGLIGKQPCTTGCPVVRPQDAIQLVPFLKESAGSFDPATKAGPALRELIRKGAVTEYPKLRLGDRLGDPIYILNPAKAAPAATPAASAPPAAS